VGANASPPASAPRPAVKPSAEIALLSSSQKTERRPIVRSCAMLPNAVTDEMIATRISGATVASRTLM
jgi:hypothetical protein